jgi:hypothetical protein
MRNLIKLEELFIFALSIFLFGRLDYAWWWYLALFLAPDIGAIGYLANPAIGSITYNLVHHKGVAVIGYVVGAFVGSPILQLAGVIILGHSSFDRVFGYGLKYPDSFKHTHLGKIGALTKKDV